ncbi:hypothetical protein DPMN_157218 [Dreissena polymorpha]|uniref:Uncharacterized protein n=1 Tax=Dreissena polymorpha TaxID=45954 RepID=A0A9D4EJX8_DREPO|nr:hypothetical protein DPMN_157218 [Dreissena polymorpha]
MASTQSTNTQSFRSSRPATQSSQKTVKNVSWIIPVGMLTNKPTVYASAAPTPMSVVSAGDPTLPSAAHSPERSKSLCGKKNPSSSGPKPSKQL